LDSSGGGRFFAAQGTFGEQGDGILKDKGRIESARLCSEGQALASGRMIEEGFSESAAVGVASANEENDWEMHGRRKLAIVFRVASS